MTGNGDLITEPVPCLEKSELLSSSAKRNRKLLKQLHLDDFAGELVKEMEVDAETQQRMTAPVPLCETVLAQCVVSRRFARVQGTRPDGTPKVRAVDDCTGSGLNGTAVPGEKLHHHHFDQLLHVAADVKAASGDVPSLWKADIDSAYRRIPVLPEDRDLLHVAVAHEGSIHHGIQVQCDPFLGAVASVHACETLHLPVLKYVDDFFSAEVEEAASHAMNTFARLVVALMGETAISKRKLECGNPLTVLGLTLELRRDDILCFLDEKKASKWIDALHTVQKEKKMAPGDASKMAGRLSFAAQHMYMKIGRAMLKPFFSQQYSPPRGVKANGELLSACKWWTDVLTCHRHQTWGITLRNPRPFKFPPPLSNQGRMNHEVHVVN